MSEKATDELLKIITLIKERQAEGATDAKIVGDVVAFANQRITVLKSGS